MYLPPLTFVGISMATTGVLLVGWRAALAAATPKKDTSVRSRTSRKARGGVEGLPPVVRKCS